jgi:hypothetical protein
VAADQRTLTEVWFTDVTVSDEGADGAVVSGQADVVTRMLAAAER